MRGVLLAAGGARWESEALAFLGSSPDFDLTRRCVDVADLLAAAQSGGAVAALVAPDAPGFDADTVYRLTQSGVHPVAVDADVGRCQSLGITTRLEIERLEDLSLQLPAERIPSVVDQVAGQGRIVAVWGPTGGPGRSTVALGLAAAWAQQGSQTIIVDADPYGGAVAQMLGILDEVSGLLAASRGANAGRAAETAEHLYGVTERLSVLTGLPRPDLWSQVRAGATQLVLDQLRREAAISVIDCGFCLEQPDSFDSGAPRRNQLTLHSLEEADEVVAVGRADPVGLTRLVRGLHELDALLPSATVSVVLNATRSTVGWSDAQLADTVERLCDRRPVAFLPLDQAAVDAALIGGRLLQEAAADSRLTKAINHLAATWPKTPSQEHSMASLSG